MSKVNENIRNFRKFRNMSQKELGERLHKSTNVISNWETGTHSPDLDTIEELCKILKVSPDEIFGWKENDEYSQAMKKIYAYQKKIDELRSQKNNIEKQIHDLEVLKFQEVPPVDFD